ncbi:MAG: Rieske (2Fe-2S) protein [Pyrinomonadaceae bacterium]
MSHNEENKIDETRRRLLALVPAGIFTAIAASLGFASKGVLAPGAEASAKPDNWSDLGEIAEMEGTLPIAKTVTVETSTGWSKTVEDVTVFVLPEDDHKVLSSVCPHEGCPIVWEEKDKKFLCPCHDSLFTAKGKRLTGPAKDGMTELKSKIIDGTLKIQV